MENPTEATSLGMIQDLSADVREPGLHQKSLLHRSSVSVQALVVLGWCIRSCNAIQTDPDLKGGTQSQPRTILLVEPDPRIVLHAAYGRGFNSG